MSILLHVVHPVSDIHGQVFLTFADAEWFAGALLARVAQGRNSEAAR